jgi:phospholipid/cholesterol/gamma-HCH transport system substrate-binding protein
MRRGLAVALVVVAVAGLVVVGRTAWHNANRITVTGYFANSNGIYAGDEVRILGVRVGAVERIEPEPERAKITFWFDKKYQVPADAMAAILSPSLVTARALQLTPAYTGGPVMQDNAVIPQARTAVPVEWDDFREQLKALTDTLQPTQPGGVSTLGALINTSADNLRGQGPNIRETVIRMSQAFSALGDHSTDLFDTIKNLSTLVAALHDSSELMYDLNGNLAEVTGLLANDPNEVGRAARDLNTAFEDIAGFINDNRDALGTTTDKLSSISQAVADSLDDIKQTLHVAPTTFQNFTNMYQPAQGAMTAVMALNNFANPIAFVCGAIQAASRLGAEQSAKLCVQYLAPIVKNRQYNFLPIGQNPIVGAAARPNEVTYSEEWMRPEAATAGPAPTPAPAPTSEGAPAEPEALPAEASVTDGSPPSPTVATDPAAGLPGMMDPTRLGS